MVKGSCACGAVAYEAKRIQGPIVFCHCDDCKKTHASAFSSNATVRADEFCVTQGEDRLREYKPFPDKTRYFCGMCGTHIMHKMEDDPGHIKLKMGTVTDIDGFDPAEFERYHIFANITHRGPTRKTANGTSSGNRTEAPPKRVVYRPGQTLVNTRGGRLRGPKEAAC